MVSKSPKIVVIGGGTGTFVVLSGLKKYVDDLVAVVSVADSGGSAKKERDEFGLLPISDVRKAMIALAGEKDEAENLFRRLFSYRFVDGVGISGMTFGNLFLVALSQVLGSQTEAIKRAGEILRIKGKVLPVSFNQTNLVIEYENGRVIVGEHFLDEFLGDGTARIKDLYLLPPTKANPKVLDELKKADLIVLAPGDLYGSLLANLVAGIKDAVVCSKARRVFIINIMTKYGQTHGFSASDHVNEVERFLGEKCIDGIIINSAPLSPKILVHYAKKGDFPVYDDLGQDPRVIRGDFLADMLVKHQKGDRIERSLIRHDPDKLARAIMKIFQV